MSEVAVGSHSVKLKSIGELMVLDPVGSNTSTPLPAPAQAVRFFSPSPVMSWKVFEDDNCVMLMPLPARSRTTGLASGLVLVVKMFADAPLWSVDNWKFGATKLGR